MMPLRPSRLLTLAAALLVALPLAGCVDNVQDLKDRVTGIEAVDTASTDALDGAAQAGLPPATDAAVAKPPVARISVFGDDGALLFKSSFAADETQVPTLLAGGNTVTFSAADSEAVDAKAALTEYAWTFAAFSSDGAASAGHQHGAAPSSDGHDHDHGAAASAGPTTKTGASVTETFPEDGGVWLVTLTVKDSLGATDAMALKVGVTPATVLRSVRFQGTIQAGTAHNLPSDAPVTTDTSSHVFNVSGTIGELPAMPLKATLTLHGKDQRSVDLDLDVTDPTGTAGPSARTDTSEETLTLDMPKVGDWTAVVSGNVAVVADYELVVEVTYQPTHPEVVKVFGGAAAAGGDGHDHAH